MTMKLSVLALVIATSAMSSHAQVNDKTLPVTTKATHAPVRGGMYEVMPNLQAVATNDTAASNVVAELGAQSIVEKPQAATITSTDKIQAGTVVKNRFTGEYGVYSGKLLVLVKDDVSFATVQKQFGLTLVKKTGSEKLVVVKSASNQDLKELTKQLKASGLVESVRIDILERRKVAY